VAEVKIQEGESIESALRRSSGRQQEDIIKDIKKHSFYLKPATNAGQSRPRTEAQPQEARRETE
jgi:small subunit ribosomal protein S21